MTPLAVLVFSVAIFTSHSAKLPETFQKCDYKSIDECWPGAIQNAISQATKSFKSVAIPNIEPLEVPSLVIGAGSGAVKVEQNFKDVKIHGPSKLQIKKIHFNKENKTLNVDAFFPELKLEAKYVLDGQILLLPIKGEGPSTIILNKVTADCNLTFEIIEKGGEEYFNFLTSKVSLNPEKVSFNFENLFNGDKTLGDNINKVLNENEKEVFADVKSGYEEAFAKIILGLIKGPFSRVPLKDVFEHYP